VASSESTISERTKIPLGKALAMSALALAAGAGFVEFKRDVSGMRDDIRAVRLYLQAGVVSRTDMDNWLKLTRALNAGTEVIFPEFPKAEIGPDK